MIARAASEPLAAGTLVMKEPRMRTRPFWFARFESIHPNPLKLRNKMGIQKIDHLWKDSIKSRSVYMLWGNYIIIIYRLILCIDILYIDLIDRHQILDWNDVLYWNRAWSMNMTSCFTQGPGHGECYIMLTQKQVLVTKNLPSNVIVNVKRNLPHSPTRRTQVQPLDPLGREPFAAAKYNRQASAPASPISHLSKFKRWMAAFVLRTSAIACKKKAVIQPKWKHPSFTCE